MITVCAILSALIHLGVATFQVLLAAGKPWGIYAFGGQHAGVLPRHLRIAGVFSCLLLLGFATVNLTQAGLLPFTGSGPFWRIAVWVIAGYGVLGTFMNAISRSKPERLLWTPVCMILAALNLALVLNGSAV